MIEAAGFVFDNADRLTINIIMCVIAVYAVWRMHWFESKHDKEFLALRTEHKEEMLLINSKFTTSIEKLTTEIENSNKERAQITSLLSAMKDFQISINNALSDHDRVLNEILIRLGSDKGVYERKNSFNPSVYQSSMYGVPHTPKREKITNWSEGE